MRSSLAFAALAAGAAAQQDAPVSVNQPAGAVYTATLPTDAFFTSGSLNGNIQGRIAAQAAPDGKGVLFQVSLSNIPVDGGPFIYHIHEKAAIDGNCTSTGAHLDPYAVGEDHVCDPDHPEQCQVGDLSGKHGNICDPSFVDQYVDLEASTDPASPAFFGDKAFVVHFANKTRITCANFAQNGAPPAPPNLITTPPLEPASPPPFSNLSALGNLTAIIVPSNLTVVPSNLTVVPSNLTAVPTTPLPGAAQPTGANNNGNGNGNGNGATPPASSSSATPPPTNGASPLAAGALPSFVGALALVFCLAL